MAVNKGEYYDWQNGSKADKVRFRKASPNMVAGMSWLIKLFGGSNAGIFARRPVRGGDKPSSHSFGAAMDWRYPSRRTGQIAMKTLVNHSKEFGVQLIVDYVGCAIWSPAKGWRKATPNKHGMGQEWAKWIHVETTKSQWGDGSDWGART